MASQNENWPWGPVAAQPLAAGTCKAPHLVTLAEERDNAKRLAAAFEARCKELEAEVAELKRGEKQMALEFGDLADECRSLETKLKIAELAHDKRLAEIDELRSQLAKRPKVAAQPVA